MIFDPPSSLSLADLAQTHSWGECIAEPERVAAKAFCERCRPGRNASAFRVRGLEGIAFEIKGTRGVECPHCGYALFWSRSYTEVMKG